MCDDCGNCFNGENGLDFHKSRSPTCNSIAKTHPALLAYKTTDVQSIPNVAGPMTPPESARDVREVRSKTTIHTGRKALDSIIQQPTAAVRRKHTISTSPADGNQAAKLGVGRRTSTVAGGTALEDLGLSSHSSGDEIDPEDEWQQENAADVEPSSRKTRSAKEKAMKQVRLSPGMDSLEPVSVP